MNKLRKKCILVLWKTNSTWPNLCLQPDRSYSQMTQNQIDRMKKAVLLRLLILNLACILFAAMPGMAQGFRSPQDSLSFIHDSIQRIVDSRPDSNRHGFFHAERFHSSFHVQAEGDFGYQMTKMSAVVGFQAAWGDQSQNIHRYQIRPADQHRECKQVHL